MQINSSIHHKTPAFKGNIVKNAAENLGKTFKHYPSKLLSKAANIIEYVDRDMPFPVLFGSMIAGVLAPRLIKAQDKFDREEILRRDSITISTIVLGFPAISKAFSKLNEKRSGLALTTKAEDFKKKSVAGKIFDYLRPVKGTHLLSSDQIVKHYSDIENYGGEANGFAKFCNFIDEQDGNLKKVFSLKEETKDLIKGFCGSEEAFTNADNKTIIEAIKEAPVDKLKELGSHFKGADNVFVKRAKSLNSSFKFLAMVGLVPLFLGILLPKMNEKITKQKIANRKKELENQQTIPGHHKIYQNPYFMAVNKSEKKQESGVFSKF